MVIKTDKSEYCFMENTGVLVNTEIADEIEAFINEMVPEDIKNFEYINIHKTPQKCDIQKSLKDVQSLALSFTERCNLRCGYCIYSGKYYDVRSHSTKDMPIDVVKKAIKLFFKTLNSKERRSVRSEVYIGFYGGEPLLRPEELKETVRYAEDLFTANSDGKKFDLKFRVTTNGMLLNEELIEFFIKHDVLIDISYEGPEKEHNRFRKRVNGKGSWEHVHKNILLLRSLNPEYYSKNVLFQCTLHPEHDGKEIDKWFNSNKDLFGENRVNYALVTQDFLKDSKDDIVSSFKKDSFSNNYKENMLEQAVSSRLILNPHKNIFNGTCIPGAVKWYIDAKGEIHICEKVSEIYPIGNVDDGINIDKILEYLDTWNDSIKSKECWKCNVRFLCRACFAGAENMNISCDKEGLYDLLGLFLRNKESRVYEDRTDPSNSIELLKQLQ